MCVRCFDPVFVRLVVWGRPSHTFPPPLTPHIHHRPPQPKQARDFTPLSKEMKRPDDEAWVVAKWGDKFGIKVSRELVSQSMIRGRNPLHPLWTVDAPTNPPLHAPIQQVWSQPGEIRVYKVFVDGTLVRLMSYFFCW